MKRTVVCLGAAYFLLAGMNAAHAQFTKPADGPFHDVPLADRAYRDVNTLHDAGALTGGTGDYFYSKGGRGTRYNFIVIAVRLLSLVSPASDAAPAKRSDYLTPDAGPKLTHSLPAMVALMELSRDFRYELEQKLHINVSSAQAHLVALMRTTAAMTQPLDRAFPDVPPDHWAAQAVETSHEAGIVVGYPSHGFNTEHIPPSREQSAP